MLDVGLSEILLIAIVTIVFVGPEDLPKLMRTLGQYYGKLRRASDELRSAFQLEVDRVEADRRAEEIRRRREELLAKRRAQAAQEPGGPTPRPDDGPVAVPLAPAPPPSAGSEAAGSEAAGSEAAVSVEGAPVARVEPAASAGQEAPTPDVFPRSESFLAEDDRPRRGEPR